jgi:hypothetical protein
LALQRTSQLVKSAGLDEIIQTPTEGLQLAAAPGFLVVESLLATFDTIARGLLAFFSGFSNMQPPIAPVVPPIMDSPPLVIDPKRPRWALHNGMVDELAAYSIVVAPDQHFDLKDFGPAGRANVDDPVIRIEFDSPPLHGQIVPGDAAGSFCYSSDPGFSGVDTSRFRVTRASGQSVAGSVTIVVADHERPARPALPVRQVEFPIDDPGVSDFTPDKRDSGPR